MQSYMSNKTYDIAKRLVQLILPAFASLYFGLSEIWGFPFGAEVVGTLALVTTFLGISLGISTSNYQASGAGTSGIITVTEDESTKRLDIDLTEDPYDFDQKDEVTLKVVRE